MLLAAKHLYWKLRRATLKKIVPEFIWPNTISLNGTEIEIRRMPFSFGVKLSLVKGSYEIHERELLDQSNLVGATVIEMGASIAVLTRIVANKVGEGGRVIGIEASPGVAKIAKQVTRGYANIKILEGLAFPTFKVMQRERFESFQEDGGTLGGKVIFSDPRSHASKLQTNVYDLDAICSGMQKPPSVLICDIEGAERVLLDSPPRIPLSIRTILIELHPNIYGSVTAERILEVLRAEGLKIVDKKGTSFLMTRAAIS